MGKFILIGTTIFCSLFLAVSIQAGEVHEAAKSGDIAKLKALLDNDKELLYVQDEQGKTPLHWATGRGQLEAMRLLLDIYKVNVDVRNKNQGTPLHVAASQAQSEAGIILIQHGATIDAQAKDNATPLHYAAFKGRKPGHIEMVRILLENKADPNARMDNGATPLSMATSRNNTQVIQLLRQAGARNSGSSGKDRRSMMGRQRMMADQGMMDEQY